MYAPPMKEGLDYEANYVGEVLTEEALTEFVARWKLQEDAHHFLFTQPLEVQRKIVMEFRPRDAERDANAIFMKFAQGVSQAFQGSDEIQAFITRWSLGAEASQLLGTLTPMVRSRVMREFSPRDATSDANNIFIRFAEGVANRVPRVSKGKGKGGGKGWYPAPQQHFSPIASNYHAGQQGNLPADLGQFVMRWGLRAEAQQLLQSLPPMAQQKIMQEFSPRDASRDVNAIFMKFAAGVGQGIGHGGGGGNYGGGGGFFQAAPVRQMPVNTPVNEAQAFLDRWRLGLEAQQIFYGLLPAQQQKVMAEFCPRDPTSDCNNIFQRFCQGIARGIPQKAAKGGVGGGKGFNPY